MSGLTEFVGNHGARNSANRQAAGGTEQHATTALLILLVIPTVFAMAA